MNEAKKRAYEVVKNYFSSYINEQKAGFSWAEETRCAYSGAAHLYETIFDEEFILTPEDREQIMGKQEEV